MSTRKLELNVVEKSDSPAEQPAGRSGESKMENVVGIFNAREAEQARLQLHLMGVDNDKIAALSLK